MMLLSWAWWTQKLAGVLPQALAAALAVALVIGGLWWLRHDARMDERGAGERRTLSASLAAEQHARERERKAEAVAAKAAEDWQAQLAASEAARQDAEARLEAMRGRVVAYPKEIVEALNR